MGFGGSVCVCRAPAQVYAPSNQTQGTMCAVQTMWRFSWSTLRRVWWFSVQPGPSLSVSGQYCTELVSSWSEYCRSETLISSCASTNTLLSFMNVRLRSELASVSQPRTSNSRSSWPCVSYVERPSKSRFKPSGTSPERHKLGPETRIAKRAFAHGQSLV